jgi:hypothetical protein
MHILALDGLRLSAPRDATETVSYISFVFRVKIPASGDDKAYETFRSDSFCAKYSTIHDAHYARVGPTLRHVVGAPRHCTRKGEIAPPRPSHRRRPPCDWTTEGVGSWHGEGGKVVGHPPVGGGQAERGAAAAARSPRMLHSLLSAALLLPVARPGGSHALLRALPKAAVESTWGASGERWWSNSASHRAPFAAPNPAVASRPAPLR